MAGFCSRFAGCRGSGGPSAFALGGSEDGAGRRGSLWARPQLVRVASSIGAADTLCPPGACASRISEDSAEHNSAEQNDRVPNKLHSSVSHDRNELPDPNHVLGTVADPADAFRMSSNMSSTALADDLEVDATPGMGRKRMSLDEAGLRGAHGYGRLGGGVAATSRLSFTADTQSEIVRQEDAEAVARRRGAMVAAAMQNWAYESSPAMTAPSSSLKTVPSPSADEAGRFASARAAVENRRVREAAGAHAVSYDSLGNSGIHIRGASLGHDATARMAAAEDAAAPAATAATAAAPDAAAASATGGAATSPMAELLQTVLQPPPSRRNAADEVDTEEELQRLKRIVGQLGAQLDRMVSAHTRDQAGQQ